MKNDETPIKRVLRDIGQRAGDGPAAMAEKLGVSRTFFNFVETGHKAAPERFISAVAEKYSLTDEQLEELKTAAWASTKTCKLDISGLSYSDRYIVKDMVEKVEHGDGK